MTERKVTVTLPESLYIRAKETADAASLSIEKVLEQSIWRALPGLEEDLPRQLRNDLVRLSLLTDEELWSTANTEMASAAQDRLEELVDRQKLTELTESEQIELDQLITQAQNIMLKKAEAYRLLSFRGYKVFPQTTPK
jgi:hypothetical protein